MYYAQIDEQGVCIAVSDLSGEVIADNMIPLESYDMEILGKKWDGKKWIENPNPPEPEPMPEPITLEQLDKQQKEILARLDAMGGGDTVAVSTLDDAYTKGVNSVE